MWTLIIRVAVFDAACSFISRCCASGLVAVYAGLLMQNKKKHTVRTLTIVSVNKISAEMLLELKGNLARVAACVFSALVVVGFTAKSTHSPAVELHSGGDASKSPGLLSAVIHTGEAGFRLQGHHSMAQDKSLILGCNCQE